LAHTQHAWLPIIQVTDLGGVFVVSLVVAVANAMVFDIAYQIPAIRRWFNQEDIETYRYYASVDILNRGILAECLFRRNLILETPAAALLLTGVYVYGLARLQEDKFFAGPTVCLLQSNLDQRLREGPRVDPEATCVGVIAGMATHAFVERSESIEEHFAKL